MIRATAGTRIIIWATITGYMAPAEPKSTDEHEPNPPSPERPIRTLAEDELERKDFARAVAKVIREWKGRDSLVLAIYGPWGSGKTSLKNMIMDALAKEGTNTIRLEFNPWEWMGQDKVFEGFFNELASAVGAVDESKKAEEAAKKMRLYGKMLSAAGSIAGRLRPALAGLSFVFGFACFASFLQIQEPFWHYVMLGVGSFALAASAFLTAAGQTADKIADYFSAKADAKRKSVREAKDDLHTLFEALPRNLLVVADDIDRLTPEGIRMVFQLVKANADFPNVIYLLLFQRDTVEHALTTRYPGGDLNGAEFLQKIVQVGFDIPKLSPEKLEAAIESVVSAVVQNTPAESKFDSQRWARLFPSGIRPYFQTLRDVKRFSNTLSFHLELYKNGDTFDANPIDLIALEALREFETSTYKKLHASKDLLTGSSVAILEPSLPHQRTQLAEELVKGATRPTQLREILSDVFPPIARALAGPEAASSSSQNAAHRAEWLANLRPCHPEMFDRYFRFSLSSLDLGEAEFAFILASANDKHQLVAKLRELGKRGLLGSAILRLRAAPPAISEASIVPFITALFDVEDDLFAQPVKQRLGALPADVQAVLLVRSLLMREKPQARAPLLGEAIGRAAGIYLPMSSIYSTSEERKSALDSLLSEAEEASLHAQCVEKIRGVRAKPEFLSHPRLKLILGLWSQWSSVEEVRVWFSDMMKSDEGLTSVLGAFVEGLSHVDNERVIEMSYRFDLREFARYSEIDILFERVQALASSKSKHSDVYQLFLAAVDRFRASGHHAGPQDLEGWIRAGDLSAANSG